MAYPYTFNQNFNGYLGEEVNGPTKFDLDDVSLAGQLKNWPWFLFLFATLSHSHRMLSDYVKQIRDVQALSWMFAIAFSKIYSAASTVLFILTYLQYYWLQIFNYGYAADPHGLMYEDEIPVEDNVEDNDYVDDYPRTNYQEV